MKNTKQLLFFLFLLSFSFSLQAQKQMAQKGQYSVVINHEEQYSIWLKDQKIPNGWKATRVSGSFEKCQKYIDRVWTDMRPLSIRKKFPKDNIKYGVVFEVETTLHAVWPVEKKLPPGWKATSYQGSFQKCNQHLKTVWTDMRPRQFQGIKR